jgi:hypothetical protein
MWGKFLSVLAVYVEMKSGGPNDVSRFLKLGAAIDNARVDVKEQLEAATAKIQTLVAEDRAPTLEELAEVDASVEAKLAAIAAVDLDADPAPIG